MIDLQAYIDKAKEIIIEAGEVLLENSTKTQEVSYKSDKSPVTELDKRIERCIQQKILAEFPETGFTGEEYEPINPESDLQWFCDPIDGTRSFLEGKKTVSISLALCFKREPIIGLINNPITQELFVGSEKGVFVNHQQIILADSVNLENATVNYQMKTQHTFLHKIKEAEGQNQVKKIFYQGGSVAYNFASLVNRKADIYIWSHRNPVNLWDVAAGVILVKALGGCVTNLEGIDTADITSPKMLIASINPEVHKQFLNLLNNG